MCVPCLGLRRAESATRPLGDSCEAYFPPFQIHRPGDPQESVLICGRMSQRLSRSSFQSPVTCQCVLTCATPGTSRAADKPEPSSEVAANARLTV